MRIKVGEYIYTVDKVWVRETDLMIGNKFYQTGNRTEEIADQLLKNGYADLTHFKVR